MSQDKKTQDNKTQQKPQHSSGNKYMAFTSMAFEMIAAILIGVFIGMKADEYFETNSKILTAIFSLLGVVASTWLVLKKILNMK